MTRNSIVAALAAVAGIVVALQVWSPVSANVQMQAQINEGSDFRFCSTFTNVLNIGVQATQVKYAFHDVGTGTEHVAPTVAVPTGKRLCVDIPGDSVPIAREGFCSLAAATVCDEDSDCGSSQCIFVATEPKVLTLEFNYGASGQGTEQVFFDVVSLRHWPFP